MSDPNKHFKFILRFREKAESLIEIWTKFPDMVTKRQIEKTTIYPLFFLFIQFSAIEIRWVFSHTKLTICWLQWLLKRWGARARWWARAIFQLPCETEIPCSFFSVRDERNLCSQPHDFLSCMRELRQHLSRETPLPVFESKRHFLLFRGNSLRQLRSKKTSLCRQLLFLRRMCRLKLPQKPIDWVFPNAVWFVTTASTPFYVSKW